VLPGANDAPTMPLSGRLPVTLTNDDVVELSLHQVQRTGLEGEIACHHHGRPGVPLPGAKMPPLAIVVLPTVPMPVSAPPAFTVVRLDDAMEPSTCRKPPLTIVVPVYVFVPERISVPVPVFSRSRYPERPDSRRADWGLKSAMTPSDGRGEIVAANHERIARADV